MNVFVIVLDYRFNFFVLGETNRFYLKHLGNAEEGSNHVVYFPRALCSIYCIRMWISKCETAGHIA